MKILLESPAEANSIKKQLENWLQVPGQVIPFVLESDLKESKFGPFMVGLFIGMIIEVVVSKLFF